MSSFQHPSESTKCYEEYLSAHLLNVQRGYEWIKKYLPDILSEYNFIEEVNYYGELDNIISQHDHSKFRNYPDMDNYYELTCEYSAYKEYFFGEKTSDTETAFNKAWLAHIHANPHHWQHWVIAEQDNCQILDMPYVFIIEMICDHWSFSWKAENLYEIFDWYEENKSKMMLSSKTKTTYETILNRIRTKLDELSKVDQIT